MNITSMFSSSSSKNHIRSAFSILEKNAAVTHLFSKNSLPSQPFSDEPEIGRFTFGEKDLSGNTSSLVRQMGPSSPAASALGLTTCWNLPQGLLGFFQARKSYRRAGEIHDRAGNRCFRSRVEDGADIRRR